MISIIICSISSDRLRDIRQNIQQTVGVEYEVIGIDNSEKGWPIAKVYNYGAEQAKFPYLFFVHEDVRFHSCNWGEFIIEKLKEPSCGVIGFAGSKIRLNCYTGWGSIGKYDVVHLYQGLPNGLTEFRVAHSYLESPFEEVVVTDGLGMFVKKELWKRYPFDEEVLQGFHCYDIDFTLQVFAAHYKNYVCCSNNLLIEHFSLGNFDKDWYSITIRVHKKWRHLLPISTPDVKISVKERQKYEERFFYYFLKKMLRLDCDRCSKKEILQEFWLLPLSWKHFRHCISSMIQYVRYR